MRYERPQSNEWVFPKRRGYKMACCDCGLVHDVDFTIYKRHILFRVRRNARATGQVRRYLKKIN